MRHGQLQSLNKGKAEIIFRLGSGTVHSSHRIWALHSTEAFFPASFVRNWVRAKLSTELISGSAALGVFPSFRLAHPEGRDDDDILEPVSIA